MQKLATIEIRKQYLHFSAAHFTVFSATERERLHGHNWRVAALITGPIGDDGLCFDYAEYKAILKKICAEHDEYMLLPEYSPHLEISADDQHYYVVHHTSRMTFLKSDTLLLPVRNITIEELAHYLLHRLLAHDEQLTKHQVSRLQVEVSSGSDQWAHSVWPASL